MSLHPPPPIRSITERLEALGHETALVGRCLRELSTGLPPADFELLTAADLGSLLEVFPRAVVTAPGGGRLSIPTAAGPVDLTPLAPDTAIPEALSRRDFTIHAIAYRPAGPDADGWIDPHGGRDDLAARRLRCPGSAKDRFEEDPLRALRAARLAAELGLEIEEDVLRAMRGAAAALEARLGRRAREEIDLLLLAPGVERGLALLRESGLEPVVAPGADADAAAVVARLPRDLDLRWAGWLRGTRVRAILRNLRAPRDRALRIERLLQLHPVDAGPAPARESRARRLARRDEREVRGLIALREAEVLAHGDADRRSLDHLRRSLELARRADRLAAGRESLAIGGREVMEQLGCGPGATVGRALRFLTERVAEDPTCNDPAALRALLAEWAEAETQRSG